MKPAVRRLLWIAALAGTVAAAVWVNANDDEVITAAGERPHAAQARGRQAAAGAPAALDLEGLQAHAFDEMKVDLLAAKSWYVPPPPPPPPKPKAPPLPFTFLGRSFEDGGTAVFLGVRDRNRVVRVGDVLDRNWRVEAIGATSMTFTYLPLNESQILALGAAP